MAVMTKPTRKYRHISEVPESCSHCGGRGKVRDPRELCPIEGYKMASWYPCLPCSSTGRSTWEQRLVIYQQAQQEYREQLADYKRNADMQSILREKLNDEEMQYLKDNGYMVKVGDA